MVALVAADRLTAPEALRVARAIQASSPLFFTREILERFAVAIGEALS
jgi:hypothetical protein